MNDHNMTDSMKEKKVFQIAGLCMLATEIVKQILLTTVIGHGTYDWCFFPFQLCSITMYASLIAGFTGNRKVFDVCIGFIATFGLMGGLAAFFDTSGFYYPLTILTVHSYLWHVTLVVLGIYAAFVRDDYAFRGPVIIYLICCIIACIIDMMIFDFVGQYMNMFYISPRLIMNQVVFMDLVPIVGNNATIVIYVVVSITGAFIINNIEKGLMKHHQRRSR